jgi:hypothetical protein
VHRLRAETSGEQGPGPVVGVCPLAGCGKTLHGCHPEHSEGSRSAYLLENAQGQILRFALHRTVRGFAQNDSFEEFFRSLLGAYGPRNLMKNYHRHAGGADSR